jgi:hypothetical protein
LSFLAECDIKDYARRDAKLTPPGEQSNASTGRSYVNSANPTASQRAAKSDADFRETVTIDDLRALVDACDQLPPHVRAAIMKLIEQARP